MLATRLGNGRMLEVEVVPSFNAVDIEDLAPIKCAVAGICARHEGGTGATCTGSLRGMTITDACSSHTRMTRHRKNSAACYPASNSVRGGHDAVSACLAPFAGLTP